MPLSRAPKRARYSHIVGVTTGLLVKATTPAARAPPKSEMAMASLDETNTTVAVIYATQR